VGGAYFWPQTEEQKEAQPASVTGAAGFYTDYKSSAFGIGHQGYWSEDKWRIAVVAAAFDLNLNLQVAGGGGGRSPTDWLIEGGGFFGEVSRRIKGDWRAGVSARYIDVEQEFEPDLPNLDFDIANESRSAGLGANLEYDTRDDPFNSYKGNRFKFSILANSKSLGGDSSYESYSVLYASYHPITPKVVVAWEAQACHRSDRTPLWDAAWSICAASRSPTTLANRRHLPRWKDGGVFTADGEQSHLPVAAITETRSTRIGNAN
jgi:hypothetical protein